MQEALTKIAKKLKKNNVAVDVVSFGSEEENREKLEAFHAAVNSGNNSHLVTVPAGTILSDMLFATPIFMEEGAGDEEPAALRSNIVDGFDYGALGVDPTLDPELALALRISVEEERARQAALQGSQNQEAGDEMAGAGEEGQAEALEDQVEAMDEDTLLQEALALSMQGGSDTKAEEEGNKQGSNEKDQNTEPEDQIEVDDPELALALQMSMAEQPEEQEDKDGQS